MDVVEAKEIVRAEIDRLTPTLLEASHSIHANPELNFEEHHAHDTLTGVLEDQGLAVERGAYDMATAFARVGCCPASRARDKQERAQLAGPGAFGRLATRHCFCSGIAPRPRGRRREQRGAQSGVAPAATARALLASRAVQVAAC